MKPQQLLIIGGGNAFDTHDQYLDYLKKRKISLNHFRQSMNWKNSLQQELEPAFDVLIPQMPNNQNARYSEWKIWFERIVALLDEEVILLGHSMGGIFLAKYLSENKYPKKITALFLLAAPFNTPGRHPLVDFVIDPKLDGVEDQVKKIFIYHSKDDPIVPVVCATEYKTALPSATLRIFEDLEHLNQPKFPELLADLRTFIPYGRKAE